MGLLGTYQMNGILAGNRIRQRWRILHPTDSTHAVYNWATIHDDDDSQYRCVIDPGKRKVSGYNISMAVPGELRVGDYSITVDNSSGFFYPGTTDSHWSFTHDIYPDYLADPQECLLQHNVYVWLDGAFREIYPAAYTGRVVDVIYNDGGTHDGAQPGTATITTENNIVSEILRREWVEDDGDDDVTLTNIYMENS